MSGKRQYMSALENGYEEMDTQRRQEAQRKQDKGKVLTVLLLYGLIDLLSYRVIKLYIDVVIVIVVVVVVVVVYSSCCSILSVYRVYSIQ
jgi:hypothetical protein